MLDADSMPLVHPDELFASKAFVRHGNLFWPGKSWLFGGAHGKGSLHVTALWLCNQACKLLRLAGTSLPLRSDDGLLGGQLQVQ